MMQVRKQCSRSMSWCPRLTGKNQEVQRKSPTKLTLSLLEFKSKCLIGFSSKNIKKDFKQLRQIVLIEQFKECNHANIKTHLDESDTNNLEDVTTTADDYALTHRLSTKNTGGLYKFNQYHKGNSNRPNKEKSSQNQNNTKEGKTLSSSSSQGNKGPPSAKPVQSGDGFKTPLTCDYCKLSGHNKIKC